MTPQELNNKLDKAAPAIAEALSKLELRAAQTAFGILTLRVFTGTGGAKDTRGRNLKPYSKGYAKFRENYPGGRQTDVKDLQLTGQLFKSVDVGTKNGKPAMGFTNELASNKADWQEKQNKTVIFALSAEEKDRVVDEAKTQVIEELRKLWR